MLFVEHNRRWLYLLAIASTFSLFTWTGWRSYSDPEFASRIVKLSSVKKLQEVARPKTPQQTLFEQVFWVDPAPLYDYPTLAEFCASNPATPDAPYLNCTGISLGLTSAMSQVKVCLKMAIDSGSNLVLPKIVRRDPDHLGDFHSEDLRNYATYDEWFDVDHLRSVMSRVCPGTTIIHPNEIGTTVPVRENYRVLLIQDMFYGKFQPFFWAGRTYREWFGERYRDARAEKPEEAREGDGIIVVEVDSEFMAFDIMNDPTRTSLNFWNDISRLMRFTLPQRQVVERLTNAITKPYYAVHFRTEQDAVWSSADNQVHRTIEWLDKARARFGDSSAERPLIYVSTGDESQAEYFVAGAAERGWTATHKWALLRDDSVSTDIVNALPFDLRGAIDLGIMINADFFFGLGGSAMSFTAANYRDNTGHYRGSSFEVFNDEGAHNHLFHEADNPGYPCCL